MAEQHKNQNSSNTKNQTDMNTENLKKVLAKLELFKPVDADHLNTAIAVKCHHLLLSPDLPEEIKPLLKVILNNSSECFYHPQDLKLFNKENTTRLITELGKLPSKEKSNTHRRGSPSPEG